MTGDLIKLMDNVTRLAAMSGLEVKEWKLKLIKKEE